MKNWKDKVLGIFAGIGVMSLLMAQTNTSTQERQKIVIGGVESHKYEYIGKTTGADFAVLNKETGNVVYHNLSLSKTKENVIWKVTPVKTTEEPVIWPIN